jgi:hypothetical protein
MNLLNHYTQKYGNFTKNAFWFRFQPKDPFSFSKSISEVSDEEIKKFLDEFQLEFKNMNLKNQYNYHRNSILNSKYIKSKGNNCPLAFILFSLTDGYEISTSVQNSCLEVYEKFIQLGGTLYMELNNDFLTHVITSSASLEMKKLFAKYIKLLKKEEIDSLNKDALMFIDFLSFELLDSELLKFAKLSDSSVKKYFKLLKSKDQWKDEDIFYLIELASLHPNILFPEINEFSFGKFPLTLPLFTYWLGQLKDCSFEEDFILQMFSYLSKHGKKSIHLDENILFYVCRIGDLDLYSMVATKYSQFINEKNSNGFTPLNIASSCGFQSLCKYAMDKFDAKMSPSVFQNLSNDVLVHVFSFMVDFKNNFDSKSLLNVKLVNVFFYQAVLSEEMWAMICANKRNILTLSRESWMVTAFSIYADERLSNSKYFKWIRTSITNGDRSWRTLSTVPEIYEDISNRKVDFEDLYLKKKIPERIYFDFKFSNANRPIDKKLMGNSTWRELKKNQFKFDDLVCECFFPNLELRRLIFQSLTITSEDMVHNSFIENVPVYSNELDVDSDFFIRFFIGKRDLDFQLMIVSDEVFILVQSNPMKRSEIQIIFDECLEGSK